MRTIMPLAPVVRLVSVVILMIFSSALHVEGANIWSNPITGTNPSSTNPYTSGQSVTTNIAVSGIGYSGATPSAGNNRFVVEGWSNTFDASRYIYFTLTPDTPGYVINFTDFSFNSQASGTGPTSIVVRSSLDNYTADIGSPTVNAGNLDLSGAAYQGVTGPITFRIYVWGASSSTGTFSVDNFTFSGTFDRPTIFYHSSGDLHVKNNWGSKSDGTGAKPFDFTTDGQTFVLRNAATSTTGNWTVSGTASKIIVPSGVTFTIAASHTVSGTIDVQNLGTVNVSWNTTPTFGTLSAGSTVNYNYAGSQNIVATTYSNLTISSGGTKSLQGNTTVNSTLTFSSGKISLGSYNLVMGTSGSISGASASNYVIADGSGVLTQQISASGSKTFPVGFSSSYMPATVALTGASTTDNFSVRLISQIRNQGTSGTVMTQDAVDATWYITEGTAGGSSATITLQWPTSMELSGFNRSACRLGHYNGSMWDYGSSDIVASGSNPYTASRSGITSFSPFGMGENTPLPVTWLDKIYGENQGENNTIHWSTASEWNNDFFEVQSSTDGKNFNVAGIVKGSGNTSDINAYQFTHEGVTQALTYYRIRQVDYNGEYSFSKMITVYHAEKSTDFTCVPNPASDVITVNKTREGFFLEIIDQQGMALKTVACTKCHTSVDISELKDGLYLLKNTYTGSFARLVKSSK